MRQLTKLSRRQIQVLSCHGRRIVTTLFSIVKSCFKDTLVFGVGMGCWSYVEDDDGSSIGLPLLIPREQAPRWVDIYPIRALRSERSWGLIPSGRIYLATKLPAIRPIHGYRESQISLALGYSSGAAQRVRRSKGRYYRITISSKKIWNKNYSWNSD